MSKVLAHTRRVLGASAASLLIAGLAHAGVEMNVGGTKVPATSMTFSVSQQPVYDPITYMPVEPAQTQLFAGSIYITRNFDASSAKILKHVISATTLPTLEIVMTADGSPDRQVWKLTDAVLNNYSTYTAEGSEVIENFDITYTTATLEMYSGGGNRPTDTVSWTASTPTAQVAQ